MQGLERAYRERIGDVVYDKAEWKKNPADRFRFYAMAAATNSNLLTAKQLDWFESHLNQIPGWEHLNPTAIALGLGCLDKKKLTHEKFEASMKALKKMPKNIGVRPVDLLRYANGWEKWFEERRFSP